MRFRSLMAVIVGAGSLVVGTGIASADPPPTGGAEVVDFDPIVVPLTGEQFQFPCGVPNVLGTFVSGTLTITGREVHTPTGDVIGMGKAVWNDVVAETQDGTVYRILARNNSVGMASGFTITTQWLILGPTGQEYVGIVIFHATQRPDGSGVTDFFQATSDAECG